MKKKIVYYPLVFAEYYFIAIEGYVFYRRFDVKILPFIKKGAVTVTIDGKDYSVLSLMLEYFFIEKQLTNKSITYSVDKRHPLRIPKRCISLTDTNHSHTANNDYFNCANRVSSANSRSVENISKSDVLIVLERGSYSCQYCGKKIKKTNWHLDHIKPLSKGGKNVVSNLCVSCKTCNLMKHSMMKNNFINKCKSIYKYNQNK